MNISLDSGLRRTPPAPSTRRTSRRLRSAALLATAAAMASTVVALAPPVSAAPGDAEVRVNQVGYIVGETKQAFAMGTSSNLSDAGFKVVDENGTTVATGGLGTSTGGWNTAYDSVHTIDLTSVNTPGTYHVELTGTAGGTSPTFKIATAHDLMDPLISDNIKFFQAQRDGRDVISSVMNRQPSHLADENATVYNNPDYQKATDETTGEQYDILAAPLTTAAGGPRNVSGGWFDAGDFLKFTHTTAYATAELLLAKRDIGTTGGMSAEAQHGVDWLDKMWDGNSKTLYAQVGIGIGNFDTIKADHDHWRLPEADDQLNVQPGDPDYLVKHRPLLRAAAPGGKISPNLAGKVAAAFALAAQSAFADNNTTLAQNYLDKAADVYDHTDFDHTGELFTVYPKTYYPENSWLDDVEFAASEMALAAQQIGDSRAGTWKENAATWARAYLDSTTKKTLGIGDVSALAHYDLLTLLNGSTLNDVSPANLTADLSRQLDDGVTRANGDPFRAGSVYTDFDAVPNTFGLIATARLYSKATGDHGYDAFATQQRSWVLGANSWGTSFVIGAGQVFPHCPVHAVANLAGSLNGTGTILRGAVVNGPNSEEKLAQSLALFPETKPCESTSPGNVAWSSFDGHNARYFDKAGAWQTVESAIDFNSMALLAFSLTAG
ncbi:glycoside hydrolase family 9 protein [Streptomyces sp. NBC_00878]|uniref:glycoside hydrolase family 9 protein n=1 Tax=Streptomyces sp. NBC_00878 TaxID=2975854 RepID=UPI0022580E21|nr:glycoside hydrolase family 9 protein [Streptomyces sp. NBC_00878]MCX4907882.1 glycoside hydrolase family 9 protein [Streptomyces sp. NBC_00878]